MIKHIRKISRDDGVDAIFAKHHLNIIVGPADSDLTGHASAAGYPIASLPLGYLDFNGRPHGLAAIARAHDDALLVRLMSAWEVSFPDRKPAPLDSVCPHARS